MRIIAGRFRGHTLRAPRGSATRPTTDRVREALFSILGDLTGRSVVDFYAGSGAIGLEALSRGARRVALVESAGPALKAIGANVERLGVSSEVVLVRAAVESCRGLLAAITPIDVAIADPPWPAADRSAQVLPGVLAGLLAPGAKIAIGHRHADPVELPEGSGLRLVSRRRWGDSGMSFFEEY